jgi:hypothetical protein
MVEDEIFGLTVFLSLSVLLFQFVMEMWNTQAALLCA